MRDRFARTFATFLVGSSLISCSGGKSAYDLHVDRARAAYERGDPAEAARHWENARAVAETREDRDEARYRAASALMRAGRVDEGRAMLEALAREGGNARASRASFDLAFYEIDHGDVQKGHAMLRAAIVSDPNHGVARDAVRRRRAFVVETRGSQAAEADLLALAADLLGSELESTARFERAKLIEQRGARTDAVAAYLDVARRFPYPNGAYWNDATLAAARLNRELGKPEAAEALLILMLDHREDATLNGSYERRYDQAAFLLAECALDRGNWVTARQRFVRLADDFGTSRWSDDALWAAATLSARHGDAETACRLAERLRREAPESRFTECARLVCPSAGRDEACADYVRRAFDAGKLRPEPTLGG